MSNIQKSEGPHLPPELVQQVLIYKNTKGLSADQKVKFLDALCGSLGLNPLTSPFEFLALNGKEVPYAKRDATDQLRRIHSVSIEKLQRETVEGVYVVTATARMPSGRTDEAVGAVTISGLKGELLANAMMKAETKAKRRVTLSICGLGMLDETEVETIPGARDVSPEQPLKSGQPEVAPPEDDEVDPREHVIGGGTQKGRTIGDLLDEKGLPATQDYINRLEKMCEREGKPLWTWARFMKVNLGRIERRLMNPGDTSQMQEEDFT